MTNKEDNYDDGDSGNSTDSEDDYEILEKNIDRLVKQSGLKGAVVLDLWKAQRGLCRLSDLPMTFTGSGIYDCVISPRVVTKPISEQNAVMVCRVAEEMRKVTNLPWKAFVALLANMSKDDF